MLVKRESIPPDGPLAWIPLGKGLLTIVDPEELIEQIKYDWRAIFSKANYYACRREIRNGKSRYYRLHRVLVDCPPGMQVHHINGDTLDNRKENLSIVEPRLHAALRLCRVNRPPPYELRFGSTTAD